MELIQVEKKNIKILERLLQLYLHDISLHFPIEFDEINGMYLYDKLDKYFNNSKNFAYFIRNNDSLLGFMLIDSNSDEMIVQEMFILNHHKSKGFGSIAVYKIFDRFKGNWVIKSLPNSQLSEKFWNRTINNYTNNNYEIIHVGKYNRAVFKFNNMDVINGD